jgi:hypothetical protein
MNEFAEAIRWAARYGLLYALPGHPASAVGAEAEARSEGNTAVMEAVAWSLQGQATGHEWLICNTCGQPRLVIFGHRGRCHMTPRCKGQEQRIAVPPRRTNAVKEAICQ